MSPYRLPSPPPRPPRAPRWPGVALAVLVGACVPVLALAVFAAVAEWPAEALSIATVVGFGLSLDD